MDAFYAAVEVRENPELAGKPLLIGGRGRRSVVSTASYEARAFGCHSAQPMAVALRRCPQAVVVPPRHDLYVEVSRELFGIFRDFTPLVEGLSLDEAFLDLTGSERLHGAAREVAEAIRARVRVELRLTCSVGVAANKFVAKIASDIQKPDGLTEVPAGSEAEFLAPLPIRKLWGVGPKTRARLEPLGVQKIGEHTVEEDLVGREALESMLMRLALRLADRLAHAELEGRCVTLKIRDNTFRTQTRQRTLGQPTRLAREIHKEACALLDAVEVEGRAFRLIGVGVSHFGEAAATQLDLLAELEGDATQPAPDRQKEEALQSVLTSVRDRFGGSGLFIGRASERSDEKD